jgi:hypothetical protein
VGWTYNYARRLRALYKLVKKYNNIILLPINIGLLCRWAAKLEDFLETSPDKVLFGGTFEAVPWEKCVLDWF